jgi:hypothetical protein
VNTAASSLAGYNALGVSAEYGPLPQWQARCTVRSALNVGYDVPVLENKLNLMPFGQQTGSALGVRTPELLPDEDDYLAQVPKTTIVQNHGWL